MKLSFVAACLAVSVKVISAAVVELEETLVKDNKFWEFAESQTLDEFRAAIELKVESSCPDLWANISSVDKLAPEKHVWYIARHYDTRWKADDSLIWEMGLSEFLPSIMLADNPSFVEDLSINLLDQVMNPWNLAKYDAVNLAKTVFDLDVFSNEPLQMYKPVRIIELKTRRKDLGCDISLAINNGDINTLDRCIDEGVWIPIIDHLYHAVHNNLMSFLLHLQKKIKKVPSARHIDLLGRYDLFDVIDNILPRHSGWKPRQHNINDAVSGGLVKALEFYASIDPNMPPPTEAAIIYAIRSGRWHAVEFCLKKWHRVFNSFKLNGKGVEQHSVSWLAKLGLVEVLKWNAKAHLNAFLPSEDDMNTALRNHHFELLEWRASIKPTWAVDPEQIKAAALRGDSEILDWYKSITPCCDSNDEAV